MKIVINACYGGFSISETAVRRARELGAEWAFREVLEGETYPDGAICDWSNSGRPKDRTDQILIQVIEELGERANGHCARLKIEELTPGTRYRIQEYDGLEWIETEADIEWSVAS